MEETYAQPRGKTHLLFPFIVAATSISIVLAVLLFTVGDLVIVLPSEDYRTYNDVIFWILFAGVMVASFPLASRFPKDESELTGKMLPILLCGILMFVLFVVLVWKGTVGSTANVSPFSDEYQVLVITEGLTLFCAFFGLYCELLATRIWRRTRSSWS